MKKQVFLLDFQRDSVLAFPFAEHLQLDFLQVLYVPHDREEKVAHPLLCLNRNFPLPWKPWYENDLVFRILLGGFHLLQNEHLK